MQSTLNNKTDPHFREGVQGMEDTQTRNPPPKRLCFRACSHLPCSIQGYRISSLDVIERWSLCYHLGCVVTSLAKVGLEQSNQSPLENCKIEDLKKAEWYMARELSLPQKCQLATIGEQPFTTEAVLEDWQLSSSFHLSEALYHIKASKSPSMREESLREALKHLSAEIAAEIQILKGGINGTTRKQDPCFEVKYSSAKAGEPELASNEGVGSRMEQHNQRGKRRKRMKATLNKKSEQACLGQTGLKQAYLEQTSLGHTQSAQGSQIGHFLKQNAPALIVVSLMIVCVMTAPTFGVSVDALKAPVKALRDDIFGGWMWVAKIGAAVGGCVMAVYQRDIVPMATGAAVGLGIHFYDGYFGDPTAGALI